MGEIKDYEGVIAEMIFHNKENGYTAGDENEYRELEQFIEQRTAFLSGEWLE